MANNNKSKNKEPSTAPQPDVWYDLTLGSSFKDNSSTKFCTLRYESRPASIDKSQTGFLHKRKDNKVTVEFQSNQPGKPKWLFDGGIEDHKDNDAVLFFDGETFRLERLHRSVKRLRRGAMDGQATDARSPPIGRGAKGQSSIKAVVNSVPVEMERIDIGEPKSPGLKSTGKGVVDNPSAQPFTSPEPVENRELEEHLNMLFEDVEREDKANTGEQEVNTGFDINIPNQNDVDEEIADVDVSDDEAGNRPNAAETLRAQVNAEGSGASTSSSSESSGSGSSGSGSGSTSSSDSSDDDSVNSI
ncbi:Rna polymerase ii transcription elongation factor [Thalictrum thalictroides]|uniref:Rna polymerase ii transcription elongation factor n=1 Tax=Thalictrum thalictroides TaxID=46969 RepID=A0A7J6WRF3_THATH|nr:Rna polymerase ii transcription elongation factor [Thalictrum thalictroides]